MLAAVRDVKERLDAAVKTTAWSGVAAAAGLVMLGFLCAALFLWLQAWRGPIIACLILAGVFLLVVVTAATVIAVVRRRQAERARARAAQAAQVAHWMRDPVIVTTALQVGKALGFRRAAPVLLLSAFIIGLVLSRTSVKSAHGADSPPQ